MTGAIAGRSGAHTSITIQARRRARRAARHAPASGCGPCAIVTDTHVGRLYAARLRRSLASAGFPVKALVSVPPASERVARARRPALRGSPARGSSAAARGRARRRRGRRSRRLRGRDLAARRAVGRRSDDACSPRWTRASAARTASTCRGQEPGRRVPPAPRRGDRSGGARDAAAPAPPRRARRGGEDRLRGRRAPGCPGSSETPDALAAGGRRSPCSDRVVERAVAAKARVVQADERDGRAPHRAQLRPHARARARAARRVPPAAARRGGRDRHARPQRGSRCASPDCSPRPRRVAGCACSPRSGLPRPDALARRDLGRKACKAMQQDKKRSAGELRFVLTQGVGVC